MKRSRSPALRVSLGSGVIAAIRSALAVLRLVRARAGGSPMTVMLVAAGVAASIAMLLGVGVVSLLGRDAGLERSLRRLPAGQRVVRVTTERTLGSASEYARALDPAAVGALRSVGLPGRARRALLLQGVRASDGMVVQIVALDAPESAVRAAAGRLPRACSAAIASSGALSDASASAADRRARCSRIRRTNAAAFQGWTMRAGNGAHHANVRGTDCSPRSPSIARTPRTTTRIPPPRWP